MTMTHRAPCPPPTDPDQIVDLLRRVAGRNLVLPARSGSTVCIEPPARVTVLGDLHDHAINFGRGVALAAVDEDAGHHLVLQEVIHGPSRVNGRDLSIRTLTRVASLVDAYPGRIHVLLSNHELAQARGESILKDGDDCVQAFDEGLEMLYADRAPQVADAVAEYVRSLPLAVRVGRVMCTHSLPSPRVIERFDPGVLDRMPTQEDMAPRGSAHELVWGRNINDHIADELAHAWQVDCFLCGHQPATAGWDRENARTIILASDHDAGHAAVLEGGRPYQLNDLMDALVPLAGVA